MRSEAFAWRVLKDGCIAADMEMRGARRAANQTSPREHMAAKTSIHGESALVLGPARRAISCLHYRWRRYSSDIPFVALWDLRSGRQTHSSALKDRGVTFWIRALGLIQPPKSQL